MASDSDSDVISCKRPKTKNQISEGIQNATEKVSVNENGLMSVKNNISQDEGKTKVSKRQRESEDESSVSSDEVVMSKKKVRRNSEEKLQPKKRLSAETKRRREAVRSVREEKIAALESDSESETEGSGEESLTRNKPISKFTSRSDSREQTSNTDDEKKTIQNGWVRGLRKGKCEKDEDSSSAYNSGSESNLKRSIKENKNKKCPERKGNMSDSESDEDPIGLNKSSPLSNRDGENKKNCESAHESNHSDFESKQEASSEDEKLSELSLRNKEKRLKSQVSDSETDVSESKLNRNQSKQKSPPKTNTGSSCESDTNSHGKKSPTMKTGKGKLSSKETKHVKSLVSDSESNDTPLTKCIKTKGKTNITLKEEESSDSDGPLSKSLTATVNPIKADLSDQQSSSDDDQPLVKTKEVKGGTKKEVAKILKNLRSSSEENSSDENPIKKKTSSFSQNDRKQDVAKQKKPTKKNNFRQ